MARPRKYSITAMVKAIEEYTEKTEIPSIKEICFINKWNYDTVMKLQREHDALREAILFLLYKKEFKLEKLALEGEVNRTMAIFSLKQLGWSDRDQDKINLERERLELDRQKASGGIEVELDVQADDERVIDIGKSTKRANKKCAK